MKLLFFIALNALPILWPFFGSERMRKATVKRLPNPKDCVCTIDGHYYYPNAKVCYKGKNYTCIATQNPKSLLLEHCNWQWAKGEQGNCN